MTPLEDELSLMREVLGEVEKKIAMLEADAIQHEKDIANLQRILMNIPKGV